MARRLPSQPPVLPGFSYVHVLDLLNNVPATAPQLRLIARAANAEGDVANAYFYMSYYYASIGNLPLAISQVRLALETPNSNDVDRARFRARLDQLIEYLPDEQKHLAIVPLRVYWKSSRVKIELGVGKGKTKGDQRQDLK